MQIVLNGEPREIPDDSTVATLIESVGLAAAICAAEVNKSLVPKREHHDRTLEPGDTVELVTLVGGG